MSESFSTMLGSTAGWTASVRALESARSDALFNDPWAASLAGPEGAAWLAQRTPECVLPIVLRTRFFDDYLMQTMQQTEVRQVILMAAGLDTRAFRLPWPDNTRLFELDQPAVLQYKEEVLNAAGAQPKCLRQSVAADLTMPGDQNLAAAGFDPQLPSVWLLEGFLFYIPNEVLDRVLNSVSALAASGSRLGFDVINSAMLTSPWTKAWVEMQASSGAPWIGVLDDPEGFLGSLGWQASLTQAGQPEAHHGRWTLPVFPTKMEGMPHNWFVTAVKA